MTYGSTVAAVEPYALDPIDDAERHGRPRDLFPLWFGANAETATFAIGILTVALYGTSLHDAIVGLVIGNLLGYAIVGLVSRSGPRFGLPQMVVSRLAFGVDGNVMPAVLAFLAGVGWFAVASVFGAQALAALTGLGYPIALAVLAVVQIVLAVYGHNAIHAFERIASVLLVGGFAIVALAVFGHGPIPDAFNPGAPFAGGGPGTALRSLRPRFRSAYSLGWAPCASDYARYLPASVDPRRVAWWAFAGGIAASLPLEILGAAAVAAIHAPGFASATPAETIRLVARGNPLVATIGFATVLVGTLSANALNLLPARSALRRLRSAAPRRVRRRGHGCRRSPRSRSSCCWPPHVPTRPCASVQAPSRSRWDWASSPLPSCAGRCSAGRPRSLSGCSVGLSPLPAAIRSQRRDW